MGDDGQRVETPDIVQILEAEKALTLERVLGQES
jgi:hypothetical protein